MSPQGVSILSSAAFGIIVLLNTYISYRLKARLNRVNDGVTELKKIHERRSEGIKVFIVEDNEFDIEFLERIINKIGIAYESITDGKDAMERIQYGPHIYVIDQFVGLVPGLDVHKKIKNKNANNFTIGYSGTKNDQVFTDFVADRVDRFISKDNPDAEKLLELAIRDGIVLLSNR